MLLELLMKGHPEPDKKIGGQTCAFQVRRHPTWKSKCFFLIKEDESADDFSFRKCVDHILPLPEAMQVKHDANTVLACPGGGKHRGGGKKGKSKH
jgi:predicted phosphoadenosine phosphosulfate sulfurtransferase